MAVIFRYISSTFIIIVNGGIKEDKDLMVLQKLFSISELEAYLDFLLSGASTNASTSSVSKFIFGVLMDSCCLLCNAFDCYHICIVV